MKIYLVYVGEGNEEYVDAVFSSRDKAYAYLKNNIYPTIVRRMKTTLGFSEERARQNVESQMHKDVREMTIDRLE
jgi:hypothetical protein